ncbi:MAG: endolytic transglycosylase MltG [Bacteroidetes bacterium]|nr:endolytic transglycosylase MltG [Bacteroidota bacterium]MBS1608232.1 endolytic transglycosylase MltG [Bacteroidota bacterium]
MKKIISIVLLFIIIIAAFAGWKIFGPSIATSHGDYIYIKTGENFEGVKDSLVSQNYISSPGWFDKTAKLIGFTPDKLKAGKYKVNKGMSLFNLLRMLKNGKQTPVNFVITKLRTKEEFARKAGNLFECDSAEVINFLNNIDTLKKYDLDTSNVMSIVIPDTYTYFWNTTPEKIFKKIYDNSLKFWTEERKKKAAEHGLNPTQAYTLASIIEEESNSKEDKPKIASVYLNRIEKGMPLQADPTIKFAMRDFGLKRIYEKYLQIESPYNTYRNKGLPPGPICTPSPGTIDEVLNSPKTDYLYFVAKSDLAGGSVFTSNYADHMKYAKEYQQALNKLDSNNKAKQSSQ